MGVIGAEKPLLRYLARGGTLSEPEGQQLVLRFAHRAAKDKKIAETMRAFDCTVNDLAAIYASMLEELMPRPCINLGALMLTPTLLFAEPERLESLLIEIRREVRERGEAARLDVTTRIAGARARSTQEANDRVWGRADFEIVPGRGAVGKAQPPHGLLATAKAIWRRARGRDASAPGVHPRGPGESAGSPARGAAQAAMGHQRGGPMPLANSRDREPQARMFDESFEGDTALVGDQLDEDETAEEQLADIHPLIREVAAKRAPCDSVPGATGEFGRTLTNPVPVNGSRGELKYVSRLRCSCPAAVLAHRIGSTGAGGEGNVDVYETVCAEGVHWDILILDMYYPRRSRDVPSGYRRSLFQRHAAGAPIGLSVNNRCARFPESLAQIARSTFGPDAASTLLARCAPRLGQLGVYVPPLVHKERLAHLGRQLFSHAQLLDEQPVLAPSDAEGQYNLGLALAGGQGVPKDPEQAVRWWREAAGQGHPKAQCCLGRAYSRGEGVPEDDVAAVQWYRKAAELGNADAQVLLGSAYSEGRGVAKDPGAAVQWWRKAAQQGNRGAQFRLGASYGFGQGVAKDPAVAVQWWRQAAEQGHVPAEFYLGVAYANGEGVPRDAGQAAAWWLKAADHGSAEAQFSLGLAYATGEGVPRDAVLAAEWYEKAASLGNVDAQVNLGNAYSNGEGVPEDAEKAAYWWRKAADQGDEGAQALLDLASGDWEP